MLSLLFLLQVVLSIFGAKMANVHNTDAWAKGYLDASNDFNGVNGHGYDPSTSLSDKINYKSGYDQGWSDAGKGVYGPFC
jgi:hypothetical protein